MRFRYSWRKMDKLFANNGDPDQMQRSAVSDLGLHCLPITLLGYPDCNGLNLLGKIKLNISCESSARQFPWNTKVFFSTNNNNNNNNNNNQNVVCCSCVLICPYIMIYMYQPVSTPPVYVEWFVPKVCVEPAQRLIRLTLLVIIISFITKADDTLHIFS